MSWIALGFVAFGSLSVFLLCAADHFTAQEEEIGATAIISAFWLWPIALPVIVASLLWAERKEPSVQQALSGGAERSDCETNHEYNIITQLIERGRLET